MEEIWKSIRGFEGLYEISNFGRVKSLARTVKFSDGRNRLLKVEEKILRAGKNCRGYLIINLCRNGRKSHKVHILVWDHFGNEKRILGVKEIDHKDNDKTNNHINNLQLLPHRSNTNKSMLLNRKNKLPNGVSKIGNRFYVRLQINDGRVSLGGYATPEEASIVYQNKLKELSND